MKTVVLNAPSTVMTPNEARVQKYYGVQVNSSIKEKCFIQSRAYNSGTFVTVSMHELTAQNSYGGSLSLHEEIERCLKMGWPVFEFDSAKELFEWMTS